jgi:hypothetical protein
VVIECVSTPSDPSTAVVPAHYVSHHIENRKSSSNNNHTKETPRPATFTHPYTRSKTPGKSWTAIHPSGFAI